MQWLAHPVTTIQDGGIVRAARNSKTGFVKMVFNFLVKQELLIESGDRYYPTDRFRALIENYFDDYRGRLAQLLTENME